MSKEIVNIENHLKKINSRYSIKSLEFVVFIIQCIIDEKGTKISTEDIIGCFPKYVFKETGYLWNCTLKEFNIFSWEDLGDIIFICIDVGIFSRSPEDKLEDFIAAEERNSLVNTFKNLEKSGYIVKEIVEYGN